MAEVVVTAHNEAKLRSFCVSPELLPLWWDAVRELLRRGLEPSEGEQSLDDLLRCIYRGYAHLFVVVDATDQVVFAWAVELIQYPQYRVARIIALAGSHMKAGLLFEEAFEAWARVHDVLYIEGWCKPAQARLFKRYGFSPVYQIVRRTVKRRLQ